MRISSTTCLLVLTAWARLLGSSTPAFSTERWFEQSDFCKFTRFSLSSSLSTWSPLWQMQAFQIFKLENTSQASSPLLWRNTTFQDVLVFKKKYECHFSLKQVGSIFKLMQLQIWLAPNSIRQELAVRTTAGSLQVLRQWWEIIAEGTADWKIHCYVTCLL